MKIKIANQTSNFHVCPSLCWFTTKKNQFWKYAQCQHYN